MLRERTAVSNRPTANSLSQRTVTTKLPQQSKRSPKLSSLPPGDITIKLVGNLKENIHELVSRLGCPEECRQQFEYILNLYGKKIQKLREERNFWRDMIKVKQENHKTTVTQLQMKIQRLEEELKEKSKVQSICERCTCFDQHEQFTEKSSQAFKACDLDQVGPSTNRFREEYLPQFTGSTKKDNEESSLPQQDPRSQKLQSNQQELLIQNDSEEVSSVLKQRKLNFNRGENRKRVKIQTQESDKTLTEEQIFKLMLKYNFSMQELQNVLQDYENEHKMAYELFDSEEQRNLYRLGQRMQKQLWNKKVLHDVKRLSLLRNQTSMSNKAVHQ